MANYYVDATSGLDTGAGTILDPWQTIAKVNAPAPIVFNPGDSILFKRGQIWREELVPPSSGSAGLPITFGAYGSGAKPVICGSDTYNAAGNWTDEGGNLWYASSISWTANLFFHNGLIGAKKALKNSLAAQWDYWFDDPNNRLYIYSVGNPTGLATLLEIGKRDSCVDYTGTAYVTLENIKFQHSNGAATAQPTIGWWGGSNITIQDCDFDHAWANHIQFHNGCDDGLVQRCTFDNWNYSAGLSYGIQAIGSGGNVTNRLIVRGCYFTSTRDGAADTDHTAIMGDTLSSIAEVSRCVFNGNNGKLAGEAIYLYQTTTVADASLVQDNVIYEIGGVGIGATSIEVGGSVRTLTIQRNNLRDCCLRDVAGKHGINLRGFKAGSTIAVQYNYILRTYDGAQIHYGISVGTDDNSYPVVGAGVYHNTIVGCDDGIHIGDDSDNCVLRNDLLVNNRGYGVAQHAATVGTDADYNGYTGNVSGARQNLAAGAHDVTAGLKLTWNHRPKVGSSLIGAGQKVGGLIYGTRSDIGRWRRCSS
jgi:hypothetical protein